MRRVIYNQKGGVGKSSVACNLAAISAARGYKTLLIDLDAQCNSSRYLLGSRFEQVTASVSKYFEEAIRSGYLASKHDLTRYATPTDYRGLYVCAASPELNLQESRLAAKHKIFKLRDAVDELYESFDAIYIDTPSTFNFYTLSALIASHSVLIPFDCDDFARRAMYSLLENVAETRIDHNPNLKIEGIVINNFIGNALLPGQLVDELVSEGLPVLKTYLSASVKMRESHQLSKPLIHLVPSHKITREFLDLFAELQERLLKKPVAVAR